MRELHKESSLAYADMQKIRLCYDVSLEDPASMDKPTGSPSEAHDGPAVPSIEPPQQQQRLSEGLVTFQLKPPGMKGMALFNHMLAYGKRRVPRPTSQDRARCKCRSHFRVSEWLDVEMTHDQCVICDPTPEDLTMREIMRDAGGDGAIKKLAQRKLDSSGFINSYSCEANHPRRTARLKAAQQVAASIAEIHRLNEEDKKCKQAELKDDLQASAPAGIQKVIAAQGNVNNAKLTIDHMRAIAIVHFMQDIPKGKKIDVVKAFDTMVATNSHVLPRACAEYTTSATSQAAATADATALQLLINNASSAIHAQFSDQPLNMF